MTSSEEYDPKKYQQRHMNELKQWMLSANKKTKLAIEEINPKTGEVHTKEKNIKGGTIQKLAERHQKDTKRRVSELRNRSVADTEKPVELLQVFDDGTQIVESTTKQHLEEESQINNHCIGTNSSYTENLKKQKSRFFSIRVPGIDGGLKHYSIEYDVNQHVIMQIKTKKQRNNKHQRCRMAQRHGGFDILKI